jgi:predicted amino acid-binding ACT domain protein
MAVTVKRIALWRGEMANRVGALAEVLEPLARAGADLKVIMAYRPHGAPERAVVELSPISGKRRVEAAGSVGLGESHLPALHVVGDDRPGLGHAVTAAIAAAGVNINFLVAQVAGGRFSAVLGFDAEGDLERAAREVRRATAARRR